jgi:hypothetical protein
MEKNLGKSEIRWEIMKAMLDEFPELKRKAKEYIN